MKLKIELVCTLSQSALSVATFYWRSSAGHVAAACSLAHLLDAIIFRAIVIFFIIIEYELNNFLLGVTKRKVVKQRIDSGKQNAFEYRYGVVPTAIARI